MLAALMQADRQAAPEQRRADPLRDVLEMLAGIDQTISAEGDQPGVPRPN